MLDFISTLSVLPVNAKENSSVSNQESKDGKQVDDYFSQLLTSIYPLPTFNIANQTNLESETKNIAVENHISLPINEVETNGLFKLHDLPLQFETIDKPNLLYQEPVLSKQTDFVSSFSQTTNVSISPANTSDTTNIILTNINSFLPSLDKINSELENKNLIKQTAVISQKENLPIPTQEENLIHSQEQNKDYQITTQKINLPSNTENSIEPLAVSLSEDFANFTSKKKTETFHFTDVLKKISQIETEVLNVSSPPENQTEFPKPKGQIQETSLITNINPFATKSKGNEESIQKIFSVGTQITDKEDMSQSKDIENTQTTTIALETASVKNSVKTIGQSENVAIVNQVSNAILNNSKNVTDKQPMSLQITLFPRELGRIEIKLTRSSKGILTTNITVNSDQAYSALSSDLSHLREKLEQAGINLAQLNIQNTLYSSNEQRNQGENKRQELSIKSSMSNLTSDNGHVENPNDSLVNRVLSLRI